MTIQLSKGQRIDLTKDNPSLNKVIIGLGWDTNNFDSKFDFDLDASAFLLGKDGKCAKDADFIFYNNPTSVGIEHTGDNRTGEGDGDDEQIIVELNKIPQDIERIAITVTIHDAAERNQNFGQVFNSFVRLLEFDTNNEILRFDLGEDFSNETALVFCELYRHNGEWKFNAIGSGYSGGLAALVRSYGLTV